MRRAAKTQTGRRRPIWFLAGATMATAVAVPVPGAGQEPGLLEEPPPAAAMVCEPVPPAAEDSAATAPVDSTAAGEEAVAPDQRREAERLTNAATQAMLLGDLDGALEFLDRALRQDSTAAEALYLRSRVQLERGDAVAAAAGLCRYLALEPDGPSAPEARTRLERAAEAGAGEEYYAAFAEGVARYQAGELEAAEAAFDRVVEARPRASTAVYNRGLIRAELDRPGPARADLERYLALAPGAANADQVRRYLIDLAADDGPGATSAFLLGAVIPGAGQFYTGRPVLGTTVLGLAGGALAAGLLYERTTVRCRVADPGDTCPPDQIASTTTERPYMVPAIGVAAGVTLIAAIEAAIRAGRIRRERYAPPPSAVQVGLQRVRVHGGGIRLMLIDRRF
jgi:tetratricopeptide (TPR) repeat protein